MRRESADKAWEVSTSSTQERKSNPIVDNETNSESKVSLSKLEETILKVQQQMAEGADHVSFEMKMKDRESKQGQDPKIPESKHTNKSPSNQEKRPVLPPTSKSPSPKKIKIRVEMEKPHCKSEKIDKKVAANTVVSLMVPYFKKGKIASREAFKCCAKEFTTLMLDFKMNESHETIPLSRYTKYVDKFFAKSGNILSEGEIKHKIAQFKTVLDKYKLS